MRSTSRLFSRLFLLAFMFFCLPCLAQAPVQAYVAGQIDLMEGDVRIFNKQNTRRTAKVGDKVYEGDSIVTGPNGEIHMTMEDQGFIAVRPNTKMRIMQYRAEGDDDDKGVIGLLVGSLRSVTGWIGKFHPKSYAINTPTATIGIRGTDHEPKVIPEGSSEGDAGTYDKVNAGGSFINTPHGSVDVTPNHAAFAPHNGRAAPRVLAAVPQFFRPTRNERLIEGKHEQIQHLVERKREERRQEIRSGVRPVRPALNNGTRPGPAQRMQQARQTRMQEGPNRMPGLTEGNRQQARTNSRPQGNSQQLHQNGRPEGNSQQPHPIGKPQGNSLQQHPNGKPEGNSGQTRSEPVRKPNSSPDKRRTNLKGNVSEEKRK